MKKTDLIHTTVLIVAVLCAYSALQHLLTGLSYTLYSSDLFNRNISAFIYPELIQAFVLAIACIIMVRNGRKIADNLSGSRLNQKEEETDAVPGDSIEWQLDRHNIIFVLFIGIGLFTLIQYIPALLNELISRFREKAGALDLMKPAGRDYLILDLLRVTIGAFLIYAAPTLTNHIDSTIAARLRGTSKSA